MGCFDEPLPFGRLVDCGMVEYHEFACSLETYEWLRAGAMTHLNGEPVTLSIADRPSEFNVIVKAVTPSWIAGVRADRHAVLLAA